MGISRVGRAPLGAAYRSKLGVLTVRQWSMLVLGGMEFEDVREQVELVTEALREHRIRVLHIESELEFESVRLSEFQLIVDVLQQHSIDILTHISNAKWRGRFLILGEHSGSRFDEYLEQVNSTYSDICGMALGDIGEFQLDNAFSQTEFQYISEVEALDITEDVDGLYHDLIGRVTGGELIARSVGLFDPSQQTSRFTTEGETLPWIARSRANGIEWIMCADTNIGINGLGGNDIEFAGSPNEQFFINLVTVPL